MAAGKAKIEDRGSKIAIFHPRSSILYPQCLAVLALLFAVTHSILSSALDVPRLRGHVNDYSGLMAPERARAMEERLARFEQETGNQVAVLTIPGLEGEDLEGFSIKVADTWKIGKKGFDNGVILLIVKNDRKLRIEVGYGLEGVLPDAIASRIIREVIVPHFRANDFAGGIEAGVEAILKVTSGERLPEAAQRRAGPRGNSPFSGALLILLLVAIPIIGVLGNLSRRRSGEAWSAGGSRRYRSWGGPTFGGGFGGGGGFSGGGGGFGGGGASGGW